MELQNSIVVLIFISLTGAEIKLPPEFMIIGGPLTNALVNTLAKDEDKYQMSDFSVEEDTHFFCLDPLPRYLKDHLLNVQQKGISHYKVMLPWASILSEDISEKVDPIQVRCYSNLLNELRSANLKPVMVLCNPQSLTVKYGNWENGTLIDSFANYAQFAFATFGEKVEIWITFDDPSNIISKHKTKNTESSAIRNIILAHEKAYKIYHKEVASKGKVLSIIYHFNLFLVALNISNFFVFVYMLSPGVSMSLLYIGSRDAHSISIVIHQDKNTMNYFPDINSYILISHIIPMSICFYISIYVL